MLTNTENSYGLVSRIIHWVMSASIIIMLIVGFIMVNIAPSDQKWQIYNIHKAVGLIIFFLVFLRIIWTLSNIIVKAPLDLPDWQKKTARFNHILLYLLMIIMPLSGTLMSLTGGHDINFFDLLTIKSFMQSKEIAGTFWSIHLYSAIILVAAMILHVAAALYHHFIRKDNVLMRMIINY